MKWSSMEGKANQRIGALLTLYFPRDIAFYQRKYNMHHHDRYAEDKLMSELAPREEAAKKLCSAGLVRIELNEVVDEAAGTRRLVAFVASFMDRDSCEFDVGAQQTSSSSSASSSSSFFSSTSAAEQTDAPADRCTCHRVSICMYDDGAVDALCDCLDLSAWLCKHIRAVARKCGGLRTLNLSIDSLRSISSRDGADVIEPDDGDKSSDDEIEAIDNERAQAALQRARTQAQLNQELRGKFRAWLGEALPAGQTVNELCSSLQVLGFEIQAQQDARRTAIQAHGFFSARASSSSIPAEVAPLTSVRGRGRPQAVHQPRAHVSIEQMLLRLSQEST